MSKDDKNQRYREAARRKHRIIANYLAMKCWLAGLDTFQLSGLKWVLELERLDAERERWFVEDIKPWWPHTTYDPNSFGLGDLTLWLSRKPLDWLQDIYNDRQKNRESKERLKEQWARFDECMNAPMPELPENWHDEATMLTEMTLMASGLFEGV